MNKSRPTIRGLFRAAVIAGGTYMAYDYAATPHSMDDLALNLVDNHVLTIAPELAERRLLFGYLTGRFLTESNAAICKDIVLYNRCALKDHTGGAVAGFLSRLPSLQLEEQNETPGEKPRMPAFEPLKSWDI